MTKAQSEVYLISNICYQPSGCPRLTVLINRWLDCVGHSLIYIIVVV